MEITAALLFVIIAGGFGTLALFYGYKGYMVGGRESELKMYTYFFAAMICLGAFTLLDLLVIAGVLNISSPSSSLESLRQLLLMVTSIFIALAFKDMYMFFKSFEV